jgi:non-homologous end joining protein Ku
VKGYEVEKGQYIELTAEELEAGAIDIDEFVPENELYLGNPYCADR